MAASVCPACACTVREGWDGRACPRCRARLWRGWLLLGSGGAALTFSVIALASAYAFYHDLSEAALSVASPAPEPVDPAPPPPPEPGELKTRQEFDVDRLIYLEAPAEPSAAECDTSLLTRELFRQAFLLAAREDFGLHTRDAVLGEPVPAGTRRNHRIAIVASSIPAQSRIEVRVEAGTREARRVVHEAAIWTAKDAASIDRKALLAAEALARTEYAIALQKAGFAARRRPTAAPTALPAGIEEPLGKLSIPAQFDALRRLHQAIDTTGESDILLSALVRGYANLAVLTEHLWSVDHKVFKARALLYSQRLCRQHTGGLWYRAYAAALGGYSADALRDLAEARATGNPTPPWAGTIEALCRCDADELARRAEESSLPRLLQYLVLENGEANRAGRTVAAATLREHPACTRMYYPLARHGPADRRRLASLAYHEACRKTLPAAISDLSGLPPEAKVGRLPLGLRQGAEEDAGEPAWGCLGHLLEEDQFAAAWCRVDALAAAELPTAAFLAEIETVVREHRLGRLLPLYDRRVLDDPAGYRATVLALPCDDLQLQEQGMFTVIARGAPDHLPRRLQEAAARLERGVRDQATHLHALEDAKPRGTAARRMLESSPHAGLAMQVLLENDADLPAVIVADWAGREIHQLAVLRGLAERARRQGKLADAEQAMRRYLARSPDEIGHVRLAELYRTRNDMVRWKATLDDYLKQADQDDTHAWCRVQIAGDLMSRQDWQNARPYVEAIQTVDQDWALACAARYYEGVQDWAKAEPFVIRQSERFSAHGFAWAFWCGRTGRGDWPAAQRALEARLQKLGGRLSATERFQAAVYRTLAGQAAGAADTLAQLCRESPTELHAHLHALACEDAGRQFRRDRAWRQFPEKDTLLADLADRFRVCLEQGPSGELDVANFDRILAEMPPPRRADAAYLVGRFLGARGRHKEAIEYVQRCVGSSQAAFEIDMLAHAWLRRHRGEPTPP